MRAAAPDVAALRLALSEAEARAADTPAVSRAESLASAAREAVVAAREASTAEAVRAARHDGLAFRLGPLETALRAAESRARTAARRCTDRDTAVATIDHITAALRGNGSPDAAAPRANDGRTAPMVAGNGLSPAAAARLDDSPLAAAVRLDG